MSSKEKSFEALMADLEGLVEKLEGDELNLDEAIQSNEQALKLIKACRQRLDTARQKIEQLVETHSGEFETRELDG